MSVEEILRGALSRREALISRLHAEGTTCYRLLHGIAEGAPGLTIDRYGPVMLVQTWREPIEHALLPVLAEIASDAVSEPLVPVYNRRGKAQGGEPHLVELPDEIWGRELGLLCDARPRHRGQDPLLFLDLRVLRRRVLAAARDRSLLNLFAYTCGIGLCAAAGGASEVVNIDFAKSALAVGARNLAANHLPAERVSFLELDALGAVRRLAGVREGRRPLRASISPRQFDIVALDPPAWSKGPFGAVDVARDYPGLFKPALLATAPSGVIAATNHVASIALSDWIAVLRRTAEKAGRPLADIEILTPEEDFPSFDGAPPTKIAWCTLRDGGGGE